jgi:hypothetical protein
MSTATHAISTVIRYIDQDENNRTTSIAQDETYAEATPVEHDEYWAIADSASDQEETLPIAVTVANVVSFMLIADGDITVKTNNSGTPEDIWVLSNQRPVFWHTNMIGIAIPIDATPTITKFYFTNNSGSTVNVNLIALES